MLIVTWLIRGAGGETYSYYDVKRKKIYVLVRFALSKLTLFADSTNFKMLLDPVSLEERCKLGDPEKNIAPIAIGHDPKITKFGPYEHIYARYVWRVTLNYDHLLALLNTLTSRIFKASHRVSLLTIPPRSMNTTLFTGAQREKYRARLSQKAFGSKLFRSCLQLQSRKEVLYRICRQSFLCPVRW